jgi:hypothetical protein
VLPGLKNKQEQAPEHRRVPVYRSLLDSLVWVPSCRGRARPSRGFIGPAHFSRRLCPETFGRPRRSGDRDEEA